MPEGKSAARQDRSIPSLLRAERAFGRGLRGLLAAHSSGVIMRSCAIWILFLFRLRSRSPSILPNTSRERAACSSLVSLPSALRSIAQYPLIQRHSRMMWLRPTSSFGHLHSSSVRIDRQIGASPDLRLRRYGLPFRLMRRRRRPSPRRRDWRPSSQTSSVRSPSARSQRSRRSCLRHHFHFGRSTSTNVARRQRQARRKRARRASASKMLSARKRSST